MGRFGQSTRFCRVLTHSGLLFYRDPSSYRVDPLGRVNNYALNKVQGQNHNFTLIFFMLQQQLCCCCRSGLPTLVAAISSDKSTIATLGDSIGQHPLHCPRLALSIAVRAVPDAAMAFC